MIYKKITFLFRNKLKLVKTTMLPIMNISEWLDKEPNRTTVLAKHFGLTLGAISQWRKNGVPKRRMRAVETFTDGSVTVREMIEFAVQKGLRNL